MLLIYCQVLRKSATDGTMILTAAKSNWERNEYQRTWEMDSTWTKEDLKGGLKDMHLLSRNLFLHVEPGIKERLEREVLSRFQHQLSKDNSQV